jgi:hypothetical protein
MYSKVVAMARRIRAKPDFSTTIARAGISRARLANAAQLSSRTIDSLANPAGYGRHGYARELTAWQVAKGFAALTNQTEDQAFAQLFTVEEETSGMP